MPLVSLRSSAMAAMIAFGLAAAPARAQNIVLDAMQSATQATATVAQTTANAAQAATQATANAAQSTAQATANAQQAAQAAQANPIAAAQAMATAPAAPASSAPVPMTNCSAAGASASSPSLFRACLALTMHHSASWHAAHPTVALAKSNAFVPGIGGRPSSISPPPHGQN